MDCSPPGSSVHVISQARILEWVAIPFSRGSSWPGIKYGSPALQTDSLPSEPPGKSHNKWSQILWNSFHWEVRFISPSTEVEWPIWLVWIIEYNRRRCTRLGPFKNGSLHLLPLGTLALGEGRLLIKSLTTLRLLFCEEAQASHLERAYVGETLTVWADPTQTLWTKIFFGAILHGMRDLKLPNQGLNPCLLQWKRGVLTTRPPGKPLAKVFWNGICDANLFLYLRVLSHPAMQPSSHNSQAWEIEHSLMGKAASWVCD